MQSQFATYGEFLQSLEMTATIEPFVPMYLERITQLINKTNQFNLTTRRYTAAEVETIWRDPSHITLYGRLVDKFGDNGLVSVMIGATDGDTVHVDLWLMSCRVLKREMEQAMFDAFIEQCQANGIRRIVGEYVRPRRTAWFGSTTLLSVSSGKRKRRTARRCGPTTSRTNMRRKLSSFDVPGKWQWQQRPTPETHKHY